MSTHEKYELLKAQINVASLSKQGKAKPTQEEEEKRAKHLEEILKLKIRILEKLLTSPQKKVEITTFMNDMEGTDFIAISLKYNIHELCQEIVYENYPCLKGTVMSDISGRYVLTLK